MTLPLAGIRVLDLSVVVAGPVIARNLGDFGAEVIKVEHPVHGDPARRMGWHHDGVSLWWKARSRNKLPVTLDLAQPEGADLCLWLAARCDVVVESFRPGTLEGWGLGPARLLEANPGLVITRVSGFGQTGPYADRPCFGTLAESLSGYAGLQGTDGGPPQLPAIALADESAAAAGTIATLVALLHREREREAHGQVVDVSLHELLLSMLGPLPALYDLTGQEAPRLGNRLPFVAPRGAYRTADERWIGLSGSAPSAATRILEAIGGEDLAVDPRFATPEARLRHAEELDRVIAGWAGQLTLAEALERLQAADAPAAPVNRRAAVTPTLSGTPGAIRWAGQPMGSANDAVYGDLLGLDRAALDELRARQVV